jgi:hypothetical protein
MTGVELALQALRFDPGTTAHNLCTPTWASLPLPGRPPTSITRRQKWTDLWMS